jgi:hypothetical protein
MLGEDCRFCQVVQDRRHPKLNNLSSQLIQYQYAEEFYFYYAKPINNILRSEHSPDLIAFLEAMFWTDGLKQFFQGYARHSSRAILAAVAVKRQVDYRPNLINHSCWEIVAKREAKHQRVGLETKASDQHGEFKGLYPLREGNMLGIGANNKQGGFVDDNSFSTIVHDIYNPHFSSFFQSSLHSYESINDCLHKPDAKKTPFLAQNTEPKVGLKKVPKLSDTGKCIPRVPELRLAETILQRERHSKAILASSMDWLKARKGSSNNSPNRESSQQNSPKKVGKKMLPRKDKESQSSTKITINKRLLKSLTSHFLTSKTRTDNNLLDTNSSRKFDLPQFMLSKQARKRDKKPSKTNLIKSSRDRSTKPKRSHLVQSLEKLINPVNFDQKISAALKRKNSKSKSSAGLSSKTKKNPSVSGHFKDKSKKSSRTAIHELFNRKIANQSQKLMSPQSFYKSKFDKESTIEKSDMARTTVQQSFQKELMPRSQSGAMFLGPLYLGARDHFTKTKEIKKLGNKNGQNKLFLKGEYSNKRVRNSTDVGTKIPEHIQQINRREPWEERRKTLASTLEDKIQGVKLLEKGAKTLQLKVMAKDAKQDKKFSRSKEIPWFFRTMTNPTN